MKNPKAQSAIELVVLVSAVLFIFLAFLFVFQKTLADKSIEKREAAMHELVLDMQNELNVAAKATDGYRREFQIPEKILGAEYNITLVAGSIYLATLDNTHATSLSAQNATGNFVVGAINVIRKINGTIYLN